DECVRIELAQCCRLCFAAEPPESSVRRAVGTTGNTVAVAVERIGACQNHRVGHGVEQPESKEIGRRAMAGISGRCRERLRRDVQDSAQGGCYLLLNDLSAD